MPVNVTLSDKTPNLVTPTAELDLQSTFRSEMGKISRQSAVFFSGTVSTLVAGFFFKIYTARTLAAEGFGLYALGLSVVAFFSLFASWGIPRAMVRFLPAYGAQNDWAHLRALLLRGSLIVLATSTTLGILLALLSDVIAVRIFANPALGPILGLLSLSIPLGTVGSLIDQIAIGFHQTARSKSISSFFTFPLLIVLAVVFIQSGWGLIGYILAGLISSAAGLLVLAFVVWRLIPAPTHHAGIKSVPLDGAVWRYSFSMMFMGIWGFLSSETDKLLLGIYLPAASVGVYSVATTIGAFIPMLLVSVNSIFAPTISGLYAQGKRDLLEQLFQTLTKWILGLTLPLICIVSLWSPELMGIFGKEFQAGWGVLVIIALGQLVNVATGSVGMMLWMSGHEQIAVKSQILTSLLSLGLNISLIPMLGMLGAAVGQAMNVLAANLIAVFFVRQMLGMYPHNRQNLRLGIPSALAIGVLIVLRTVSTSLFVDLAAILIAFGLGYGTFVIVALLFGLDSNDRLVLDAVRQRMGALVRPGKTV